MLLRHLQVTPEDSTLSYLPLAHIFDRIVEEFALYSGARIGYYQVTFCAALATLQGIVSTGSL
jgi:long-subunit acyl-CoA synthetase (AMP-forming)